MTANLKYLLIKSDNRVSGSRSNFLYNIGYPVSATNIKLIYHQIPNSWYNFINEQINIDGNIITLNGSYGITDLVAAIDAQLPGTYTVSFSNITQRITIANTVNFTMNLTAIPKIAARLGYLAQNYTGANSYTASRPPDLRRYEYLHLTINQLGSYCQDKISAYLDSDAALDNQPFQSTFIIPVNSNIGGMNVFQEQSNYYQATIPDNYRLNTLNITLTGDDNKLLTDLEIEDWSMILELSA